MASLRLPTCRPHSAGDQYDPSRCESLTDEQSSKTAKDGGSNVDDVGIFRPWDLQVSTGSDGNVTIGHM